MCTARRSTCNASMEPAELQLRPVRKQDGVVNVADTPTSQAYELPAPNADLALYRGRGVLDDRSGDLLVRLTLSPRVRVVFDFKEPDTHALRRIFNVNSTDGAALTLMESGTAVRVLLTKWGGDVTTGTPTDAVTIGHPAARLHSVVFHLLNYMADIGGEPLEDSNDELDMVWAGRQVLLAGNWKVTIDARREHRAIVETLKRDGGYGFTHVGCVERTDGMAFTVPEARNMLWAIQGLLSFARGSWTAPMLPVGYGRDGGAAWREWGEPRCSEWYVPISWLDRHRQHRLADVAPGYFDRWLRGGCWQESVWRAVGFYLEANASGGRNPGMLDTRIILAQAALELLAWVLVYDGCQQSVGQEAKPPGTAADRIAALLHRAGITPAAPSGLPAFASFAQAMNADAPLAATQLRNRLTHPRRRHGQYSADLEVLLDCWRLVMWWLELVLLHEFGYSGEYITRLRGGGWPRRERTPWA